MARDTIGIKFHKRDKPIRLNRDIDRSVTGFVLRDTRGHEHHFGARQLLRSAAVYSYVASYSADAGPEKEYGLVDELQAGFDVVEPTHGPSLSPMTRAAADHVINECARKGFAFPFEKGVAVNAFQALMEVNEPFPPAELEVYSAIKGFDLEQAASFRDLAEGVIQGRSFRPAIRLPLGHGDRLREYWRNHPTS